MVSQAASGLRQQMEHKLAELGAALDGLSEEEAGKRPSAEEWCAKEILSHLMGDEGEEDFATGLRRIVDEENPLIDVTPGLPNYSPARQTMSLSQLRQSVWQQYQGMAEFLAARSDEELERKARIPLLKETPIGEDVTLAQWAGAIINLHLPVHIEQLMTVRAPREG